MPLPLRLNPFADPAVISARSRESLNRDLTVPECPVCHAPPGAGCDRHSREGDMVLLTRAPVLLAHVARILAAIARKPRLRRAVQHQFGPGAVPGELARDRRGR